MYKNSAVRPSALYKYSYHTWHRKHILKEARSQSPHTIIERQLTPNLMHLSTCYNESTLDTHTHTHTHTYFVSRDLLVFATKTAWMGIPIWGETRAIEIWNCLNRHGAGRWGAWQLGSPWSWNINQALISWITATRKNVNRQPGDGTSWVFSLHMQREAEANGKKNMIVLLPCEIKFFSYHAAFDFAFKLARASLANSWETLDAVRPGGAPCCSCAVLLCAVCWWSKMKEQLTAA